MEYLTYIAKQGDRWDTIAWQFYGDPYLYEPILRANPQYIGLPYPPPGAKLRIPVVEAEDEPEVVKAPWQTE